MNMGPQREGKGLGLKKAHLERKQHEFTTKGNAEEIVERERRTSSLNSENGRARRRATHKLRREPYKQTKKWVKAEKFLSKLEL